MGTVTLSGSVTWEQAAALKESLVRETSGPEPLILDVSALEKTDTGIVQVLLALQETCRSRGKEVELRGPIRQEVRDLIRDLGFSPQALGERVS